MADFRELYAGVGSMAGRSEWALVVHSGEAWRRIGPSLRAQRDLSGLSADWPRKVLLVIRAPPAGSAAASYHLAAVDAGAGQVDLRVEVRRRPGMEVAPPVMGASLIVAEADAAPFEGPARVRLRLPGIDPPPEAIAHER